MVDHAEPGEEEGEDGHLEGDREGNQQLGGKGEVLADANGRRDPDTLVLAEEEGVANRKDDGPAEVTAGDKEERREGDERQCHPPLFFVETGRDELPDFIEYRGAREKQSGDQSDLDLGEKGLAEA